MHKSDFRSLLGVDTAETRVVSSACVQMAAPLLAKLIGPGIELIRKNIQIIGIMGGNIELISISLITTFISPSLYRSWDAYTCTSILSFHVIPVWHRKKRGNGK